MKHKARRESVPKGGFSCRNKNASYFVFLNRISYPCTFIERPHYIFVIWYLHTLEILYFFLLNHFNRCLAFWQAQRQSGWSQDKMSEWLFLQDGQPQQYDHFSHISIVFDQKIFRCHLLSRERNLEPSRFCHGWGIWSVFRLNGELWNKFEKFERHLGNHYVLTETFSKMITASIQLDFTDQWRITHVMFVLTSHFGQQENFTLWGSRSLDEKIPLLITIFTCLLYFHFYD